MMDFILFCILGILTVAIAVFGGHVSSNNPKHRIVFYVMGFISIILIIITGYRTYLTQIAAINTAERLDKTITSLKDTSKAIENISTETVRIGRINSALQERLLDQTKTIVDLSKESINTAIGGDSFGHIEVLRPWAPDSITPVFIHQGKYPLYGVIARFTDQEKWRKMSELPSRLSTSDLLSYFPERHIGDTTEIRALRLAPIPISNNAEHSFNISFTARNRSWVQSLKLISIDGKYFVATQVHSTKGQKRDKLLHEHIDDGFPRNEKGEIEWYK